MENIFGLRRKVLIYFAIIFRFKLNNISSFIIFVLKTTTKSHSRNTTKQVDLTSRRQSENSDILFGLKFNSSMSGEA